MNLISASRKNQLKTFSDNIGKHEIFTLAASLAYTTALALAPFVLILLSLASLLGPSIQKKLYVQLATSIGEKAGAAIIEIIKNARANSALSSLSGIIGIIILAISASAIFLQLRLSLNKINEYEPTTSASGLWAFFKERFLSMGFVFAFAFLSIVSLLFSTFTAMLFRNGGGALLQLISLIVNFIIFSALFTAIYRVIPSEKLDWKKCRISGIVSAIFYLIGKNLISFYLGRAGIESAYGAAGSIVAFLAWVYYTTLTLLISYEFTNDIVLSKSSSNKTLTA